MNHSRFIPLFESLLGMCLLLASSCVSAAEPTGQDDGLVGHPSFLKDMPLRRDETYGFRPAEPLSAKLRLWETTAGGGTDERSWIDRIRGKEHVGLKHLGETGKIELVKPVGSGSDGLKIQAGPNQDIWAIIDFSMMEVTPREGTTSSEDIVTVDGTRLERISSNKIARKFEEILKDPKTPPFQIVFPKNPFRKPHTGYDKNRKMSLSTAFYSAEEAKVVVEDMEFRLQDFIWTYSEKGMQGLKDLNSGVIQRTRKTLKNIAGFRPFSSKKAPPEGKIHNRGLYGNTKPETSGLRDAMRKAATVPRD